MSGIKLAVMLVLLCVTQQLQQVSAQVRRGVKMRRERGEKMKTDVLKPKPTAPSRDRNVFKGRFSTKDKIKCTWLASGHDTFVLAISCKKGKESFDCEYAAKPSSCPQYESESKLFWKQIGRSLRKVKPPCRDSKTLIKAAVCKNGPKEAHFKLRKVSDVALQTPITPNTKTKTCSDITNRQKLAEEYCNNSWSSLCTFLFAVVENEDC